MSSDSALCQQILVELILTSPGSIPGGGLVVWQALQLDDGSVQLEMTAEPWNEIETSEWEIPEYVRDSFTSMGGHITDPTPKRVNSPAGDPDQELTGWTIIATLPPSGSD